MFFLYPKNRAHNADDDVHHGNGKGEQRNAYEWPHDPARENRQRTPPQRPLGSLSRLSAFLKPLRLDDARPHQQPASILAAIRVNVAGMPMLRSVVPGSLMRNAAFTGRTRPKADQRQDTREHQSIARWTRRCLHHSKIAANRHRDRERQPPEQAAGIIAPA